MPFFIKKPVDISPENILTIRPVARMITLLTGVKAIIIGVNNIPPPIPATIDNIPIAKLVRKKANSQSDIVPTAISVGAGACDKKEIIESPMKESVRTISIIVSSR
jgi:hypothetical protein